MPWVRHTSATLRPASPSLTIARICSSVNLLRFIGPPLKAEDPHSTRGGLLGAGHLRVRVPANADVYLHSPLLDDTQTLEVEALFSTNTERGGTGEIERSRNALAVQVLRPR